MLLAALCETLDHLDAGFVATFSDGKILHANVAAREMMKAGWPIREDDGFLQGEGRKVTATLLRSLRQAEEAAARLPFQDICLDICLAGIASPRGAAIAAMKPLVKPEPGKCRCIVAVFVTEIKAAGDHALSSVAECYGLTPAETRTLQQFVEGSTVAGVSQALAVSENTVKTHLQSIFTKTRSSRQQQLIKLVNDLRPPLKPAARAETLAQPKLARTSPVRPLSRREEASVR
jgi:DNA-binding CsgD family transcriptional regulator